MSHHDRPYGVGLAYRTVLHEQVLRHAAEIDLLELSTEDYLVRQRRIWTDPSYDRLRTVVDRFPCVAHGISLSLGSVEPLDQRYLSGTAEFLQQTGIRQFSEHLAYHRMNGLDLTMFMCMPFDDVSLDWLQANYNAVRAAIGRPFAVENVSYYFSVPESRWCEPDFLAEMLCRTDCTLLLDVTNVYNNCTNHGQDPVEYIRKLPGDRVSQMHLAGGHYQDGFLIDSHSYPVMDEVWELYEEALRHTNAEIVILERDENFRPFDAVMADVRNARELFSRHRPQSPPPAQPVSRVAAPEAARVFDPSGQTAKPDPFSDRFANLRNFQLAVVREISDKQFLRQSRRDPASVAAEYPMDAGWLRRWQACAPEQIDRLAKRWHWFEREDRKAEEEYRRIEWQQWARLLAMQEGRG